MPARAGRQSGEQQAQSFTDVMQGLGRMAEPPVNEGQSADSGQSPHYDAAKPIVPFGRSLSVGTGVVCINHHGSLPTFTESHGESWRAQLQNTVAEITRRSIVDGIVSLATCHVVRVASSYRTDRLSHSAQRLERLWQLKMGDFGLCS